MLSPGREAVMGERDRVRNGDRRQRAQDLDKRRMAKYVLCLVGLVVLCVLLYFIGRHIELSQYGEEVVRGDLSSKVDERRIITYENVEYYYNSALLNVLVMGIDQETEAAAGTNEYRNGGQADFLMLLIIDPETKSISRMQIDRDTMAEITVLGVFGNPAGTRTSQICLSHGFGDGKAQSSEFTVDAVEKLLFGTPVDFYVALNLDSIPVINDMVGGVTVLIEDDYTQYDPSMAPGTTVTLLGEQAEMFVRWRTNVGDGTNASRMRRQNVYLAALTDALFERISQSASFIGTLYDTMGDGMVTDMKRGRMINEVNKAYRYEQNEVLSIAGEHRIGEDGFMEFIADQKALEKLVLDTFFIPVNG